MRHKKKFQRFVAKVSMLGLCLQVLGSVSLSTLLLPQPVQAQDDPMDVFGSSLVGAIDSVSDTTAPLTGKISGYKWDDKNADGSWQPGEPALDGWEICLSPGLIQLRSAGAEYVIAPQPDLLCVVTGAGEWPVGYYEFTELAPISYWVRETQKDGWIQTMVPGMVDLGCEQDSQDNNFGNFKLGTISGYKWEDMDKDGIWDPGEKPLNDWQICLDYEREYAEVDLLETRIREDCVLTGAGDWEDGYYEFTNLYLGAYTPFEILQDGWTQTAGPDAVSIGSGTDSRDNNFGNAFKYPDLAVYKDDGTGIAQPGEVLTYTIKVTNEGDRDATDVIVKDHIDSVLSYVSDDAAGVPGFVSGPVKSIEGGETYYTWEFGALAVGESFSFDVKMAVAASVPVGKSTVNNTVEVFTEDDSNPDNNIANNAASDQDIVEGIIDWAPVKTSDAEYNSSQQKTLLPGDVVKYTVTVVYEGNVPLEVGLISDIMDKEGLEYIAGTSYVNSIKIEDPAISGMKMEWEVHDISVGDVFVLQYSMRVVDAALNGIYTNTFSIDGVSTSSQVLVGQILGEAVEEEEEPEEEALATTGMDFGVLLQSLMGLTGLSVLELVRKKVWL